VSSGCPASRRDGPVGLRHDTAFLVSCRSLSFPSSTDTRSEVASATGKDVAVPPPRSAEFRRRAVEWTRERTQPIAKLAKDLGVIELSALAGPLSRRRLPQGQRHRRAQD